MTMNCSVLSCLGGNDQVFLGSEGWIVWDGDAWSWPVSQRQQQWIVGHISPTYPESGVYGVCTFVNHSGDGWTRHMLQDCRREAVWHPQGRLRVKKQFTSGRGGTCPHRRMQIKV